MTQSIIELARLANIYASNQTNDTHDWQVIRDDRFAQLVRNAALEEAAEYLESVHRTRLVKFAGSIRRLKETK